MTKAVFTLVFMALAGSFASVHVFSQTTTLTLQFHGITRTSLVHRPTGYDPNKAYPLMLAFHGSNGTGAGMERITGFDAVADRNGFIVAYPDSVGPRWQLTGAATENDIAFVQELLQAMERSYRIDPARIYLSGYSQGGGMAQDLVCSNAAKFAGIAVNGANLSPARERMCRPAQAITYILFHGTADPLSPYNGGPNGTTGAVTTSAKQAVAFWSQNNKCHGTPVTTDIPDTLSDGSHQTDIRQELTGCANGASITFYTITGGGHTWPGTQRANSRLGPVSRTIDASAIIWQIFRSHSSSPSFSAK